jgi:hypothetical protein
MALSYRMAAAAWKKRAIHRRGAEARRKEKTRRKMRALRWQRKLGRQPQFLWAELSAAAEGDERWKTARIDGLIVSYGGRCLEKTSNSPQRRRGADERKDKKEDESAEVAEEIGPSAAITVGRTERCRRRRSTLEDCAYPWPSAWKRRFTSVAPPIPLLDQGLLLSFLLLRASASQR